MLLLFVPETPHETNTYAIVIHDADMQRAHRVAG